jgi:hypothetical protein
MSRCQRARAGQLWLSEGEHQLLSSRGPRETMVSSSSGAGRWQLERLFGHAIEPQVELESATLGVAAKSGKADNAEARVRTTVLSNLVGAEIDFATSQCNAG